MKADEWWRPPTIWTSPSISSGGLPIPEACWCGPAGMANAGPRASWAGSRSMAWTGSCETRLDVGTSAEVALNGVKADWIGASPVVYAKDDEAGRRDWYLLSPDGPPRALTEELATAPTRIAAAGPDVLYAFADGAYWALTGSGVRRLMETGPSVREALVFDPILGRRLKGNEAPRRNWSPAIAADGESLIVGENGATSFGGVAGKDDRVVAVSAEGLLMLRSEGLSETLIRRSLAPTRNLDSINQSLSDVVLTEAQPIVHLDINGRQTTSWLFLPRGAAP